MSYDVNITLNQVQARVLIEALDTLARIGMGQLEIVAEHIGSGRSGDVDMEVLRDRLASVKHVLGHPTNGSYGIGHQKTTKHAKIAYDLLCVLQREIAREEKHGAHSVWHHSPLHVGSEPLARVLVTQPVDARN